MHNYYPYLYNKVTFEVLEKAYGKNNAALFARSATAGVQQFPVHWGGMSHASLLFSSPRLVPHPPPSSSIFCSFPFCKPNILPGDPFSTFEAMAETLRGGLSLGLCGFGYWAHDIGGFEGNPDPALYKRWIAFGLLSSHSRLHGSGSYRVPWLIDPSEEASRVLRKFVDLKHRLVPYLYASAIESHTTGLPMLRATFLEFPEDRSSWHLDTQYMLGADLLVAPVFNAHGSVEFYLPEGKWYGVIDGKTRQGPGYVKETHGFDSIPLLLRPGRAIVLGKGGKSVVYDWSDQYTVLVNPEDGMDVEVEIPESETAQLGKTKLKLKVVGTKDRVTVTVADGSAAKGWKVEVAGKKLKKVLVDGAEPKEKLESESTLAVSSAGVKKIELTWE